MTQQQLIEIRDFSKTFYDNKTGRYHSWDHILLVRKHALLLAQDFPNIDKKVLEAACYLHDIGRSIKDEGHPDESVKIATPFLKKIGLAVGEIEALNHAVSHHDKSMILQAHTLEAKLLFDADKIEILSFTGFLRTWCWLVDEREMDMRQAMDFLWKYIRSIRKTYLQTTRAKEIVDQDVELIEKTVNRFKNWK